MSRAGSAVNLLWLHCADIHGEPHAADTQEQDHLQEAQPRGLQDEHQVSTIKGMGYGIMVLIHSVQGPDIWTPYVGSSKSRD